MRPELSRTPRLRGAVRLAVLALVASASVLVGVPASAAAGVTIDAEGHGAAIDSTYSTTLEVSGRGFQSVKGGHGGIYVWFGTVKGKWRPSQGGTSGENYVYVPDSESKNNAGFQRYVAFPGSSTASAANGGTMRADGSWSVRLVVPGPTFQGVGRNGAITRVDCRKVTCGVITVGAHGVRNANNETFTPVRVTDLGGVDAAGDPGTPGTEGSQGTDAGPSAQPGGSGVATQSADRTVGAPATGTRPARAAKGPAELKVDHASAVVGRAMSFTATGLRPGEQFTAVLDDGAAAVGPFLVGADGRASGVVQIPASTAAGTHELRLFGASKEASVKFGVSDDPDGVTTVAADESAWAWGPVAFAVVAGVVFLLALAVAVARQVRGRRAQA